MVQKLKILGVHKNCHLRHWLQISFFTCYLKLLDQQYYNIFPKVTRLMSFTRSRNKANNNAKAFPVISDLVNSHSFPLSISLAQLWTHQLNKFISRSVTRRVSTFTTYMSGHCVALGNHQILELRHPNVQMDLSPNVREI